jgi:peptidoglycan/xylan/chitin deacetylase (PgdA/CDA1 family)
MDPLRPQDPGASRSPLSAGELSARRAAARARRRRVRRRAALAAVLATVLLAGGLLVLTDGGSSSHNHHASLAGSGPPPEHAVRIPRRRANAIAAGGRAVDQVMRYTSYVKLAGRERREVALTFDDGPGAVTPRILGTLRRTRTPATFFVIGRWARAHPRLVAEEVRDGFVVGDHTDTHAFLSLLSPSAQADEIDLAAEDIQRVAGLHPRLFRPPYGSFDQATLGLLAARRMLMVLWSADTKDYSRPGVQTIVYTAVSGAQPGEIILMHDGGGDRSQTAAALPRIILRLRQRGYRLVTIPKLIADDPPPRNQPPPRPLSGRG